jgi:hypothetical protein
MNLKEWDMPPLEFFVDNGCEALAEERLKAIELI